MTKSVHNRIKTEINNILPHRQKSISFTCGLLMPRTESMQSLVALNLGIVVLVNFSISLRMDSLNARLAHLSLNIKPRVKGLFSVLLYLCLG